MPIRPTIGAVSVLILGGALAACGGGRSPSAPSSSPSMVGRLAIAQQIVATALGGIVTGSAVRQSDGVPLGKLSCQTTCTGSTCPVTCPIDERLDCPAGGTASNKGQV